MIAPDVAAAPEPVPRLDAASLLPELNRRTGAALRLTGLAYHGEVGAAYVAWPDGSEGVLTRSGAPVEELDRTAKLLADAEGTGLPVPRYRLVADLGEHRVIVQERLPGAVPQIVDNRLVRSMLELLDGFAGLGRGAADLDLHLTSSGPGFCLHETLAGYDDRSRRLLARVREIGRDRWSEPEEDLVHLDFHPANVLVHDGRIAGLIDWDGIARGDRRFALVTLTFDLCFGTRFRPGYRGLDRLAFDAVLDRLAEAPVAAVRHWWAHMSLRQVDWTIRHRHGVEVVDEYLAIAARGLDRLDAGRPLAYEDLAAEGE